MATLEGPALDDAASDDDFAYEEVEVMRCVRCQ